MSAVSALKIANSIAARRTERRFGSLSMLTTTVVAADFVTGREAGFARACSAKGEVIELVRQSEDEPGAAFIERARSLTAALGAPRLIVGGIDPDFDPEAIAEAGLPPRGAIALPEGKGLHPAQAQAMRTILDHKRTVLRAGRRFGKSLALIALAADEAIRGRPVGYFCPLYKIATPVFDALAFMLAPLIVSKNRSVGELKLSTGGVIDIWSLETSTIIARGRKYARALLDEISFVKAMDMGMLWRASISPTLVDLDGFVTVASTPWGTDPANWFFQICNDKTLGWVEMHAKSEDNPHAIAGGVGGREAHQ